MPPPFLVAALARRHLVLTVLGGLVATIPLTLGLSWLSQSGPDRLAPALRAWPGLYLSLAGISIVPALLVAWLRLPLMRGLFRRCLAHPRHRVARALLGTLLIFEAVLAAIALLGFAYTRGYVPLVGCLTLCQVFGLPWLLAALGASWWVLRVPRPKRQPHRVPA